MNERARECRLCSHLQPEWYHPGLKPTCLKGHRPRYYQRKVEWFGGPMVIPAGYRRRCEDFEPSEEER